MRIANGFQLKEVAGKFFLIQNGKKPGALHQINEMGALIFRQLEKGQEKEQILRDILAEYQVEEPELEQDVDAYFDMLRQIGALED